jgi:hypothetical protein
VQLYVTDILGVTFPGDVQRSIAYAAAAGELRDAGEVDTEASAAETDEHRLGQAWRALCAAYPDQLVVPPVADDVGELPTEWLGILHNIMCPGAAPFTPAALLDPEAVGGPEYGA